MYSYTYTPNKQNKYALFLSFAHFFAGFALLYLSKLLPSPFIMQIISVALLSVGILLTTRFCVRKYVYSIIKTEDGYDFAVNEIQGKKSTPVCRFAFDNVTGFDEATKKGTFPPSARKRGVSRYDYCPDLFSNGAYILLFSLPEGPGAVKICPDGRMIASIKSLMPKADRFTHTESDSNNVKDNT